MPDEILGGAAATAGGGGENLTAPATGAPAQAPAPATPPIPSESGAAGATPPAPASSAPQYQPLHEALRGYGVNLPQGVEGHAALQYIVNQLHQGQQLRQLAQYGQQYVQHADKFNSWMRQQEEQEAATKAKSWWNPPEWNPEWRNKVTLDPQTGEVKPVAGADPSVPQKYLAAMDFRREFIDKFTQDPIAAIRPGIEEVVRGLAGELIQGQLQQVQDRQQAVSFVGQHKDWMCARGPGGELAFNPQTGLPTDLSPAGKRFMHYLQEAHDIGVANERARHQYALKNTQLDYFAAQHQSQQQQAQAQAQQGTQRQQSQEQFLQQAGAVRQPSPSGSLNQPPTGRPQNGRLNLAEMLRQTVKEKGITDEQIAGTFNGRN
jgi:pyruvate/2-oxoglutarate dehydrogenase complex dihydrolipoamide acyltransferase (E2) component